jgi:predicted nucleic acid-binding protein
MKALLHTCVLSELQKPNGNPMVKQIIAEYPVADVFISVITIGEIAKGIALLDNGKRKIQLLSWLNGLETDVETARL